MIRCQNGLRLSRFAPLLIVVRMNEPISGPCTEPTAPNRLVPPMTEEAIACSSQPFGLRRVADADPHGEQDAAERGAERRHDIGEIGDRLDVDAGKPRGLLVRTDREQVAAPAALVEQDVGGDGDDDHHPEQHRDLEPSPVRPWETEEGRAREAGEGVVGDRNRRAVGDEKADAAQRIHRRQRHDERRQAHLHDAESVEEADEDADRQRDRHRAGDRRGDAEIVGQQPRHRHRR